MIFVDDKAVATRDANLLVQVSGFAVLLLVGFAENALGFLPAFYGSAPKIALMAVFLYALFHESATPPWMVFVAGIIFDLTAGNPPGYSSALMLFTHLVASRRRAMLLIGGMTEAWQAFIMTMCMTACLGFVIITIYVGGLPALQPLLVQYGLTMLLFPVGLWIYQLVNGFVVLAERYL